MFDCVVYDNCLVFSCEQFGSVWFKTRSVNVNNNNNNNTYIHTYIHTVAVMHSMYLSR
jgi:hypothetical protein